jgi:hypothetical protein
MTSQRAVVPELRDVRCCESCKHEDKFIDKYGSIDEPYLCTKGARSKKGLNGCRTVTTKERCLIREMGCAQWQKK